MRVFACRLDRAISHGLDDGYRTFPLCAPKGNWLLILSSADRRADLPTGAIDLGNPRSNFFRNGAVTAAQAQPLADRLNIDVQLLVGRSPKEIVRRLMQRAIDDDEANRRAMRTARRWMADEAGDETLKLEES